MFSRDFARKHSGICTTPRSSIFSLLYHSSVNSVLMTSKPLDFRAATAFSLVAMISSWVFPAIGWDSIAFLIAASSFSNLV